MSEHKHSLLKPFTSKQKCDFIVLWNHNNGLVISEDANGIYADDPPVPPVTIADYDKALEDHLMTERTERGYTTREPSLYINSTNARWKQDAEDWVAHVDAVMTYGLEIENKYEAGEPIPTLDEFKEALPDIVWTYEVSESETAAEAN